jgi:hypothetical protein
MPVCDCIVEGIRILKLYGTVNVGTGHGFLWITFPDDIVMIQASDIGLLTACGWYVATNSGNWTLAV